MISPDTHSAADVVRLLQLEPLAEEGGWFRRSAEATRLCPVAGGASAAGGEAGSVRAWSMIYALFTPEAFSALHRLTRDELWFFHAGDPLESLRLHESPEESADAGTWVRLGLDPAAGQRPQDMVRAGVWQGTRLVAGGRWALVSCVVVPEFAWECFTLADRADAVRRWPAWAEAITALTRDVPPAGAR